MPVATWNGAILAQSDDTIVVEGNHYFPANAINPAFLKKAPHSRTARGRVLPATKR